MKNDTRGSREKREKTAFTKHTKLKVNTKRLQFGFLSIRHFLITILIHIRHIDFRVRFAFSIIVTLILCLVFLLLVLVFLFFNLFLFRLFLVI